jgi:hypothetical protein
MLRLRSPAVGLRYSSRLSSCESFLFHFRNKTRGLRSKRLSIRRLAGPLLVKAVLTSRGTPFYISSLHTLNLYMILFVLREGLQTVMDSSSARDHYKSCSMFFMPDNDSCLLSH